MRVGIFTSNSVNKLHPRIEMQFRILKNEGFDVSIIKSKTRREGFVYELFNLVFLKYFKWKFINQNKNKLDKFDIVHIYDLQLLPLTKYAQRKNIRVIYETLDDNVFLNFHAVSKKVPILRLFKSPVTKLLQGYEKKMAIKYCDKVIVNSSNLLDNFNEANLIYYASHLEGLTIERYDRTKITAFIYIGKLNKGKGANEYVNLVNTFDIPLLFIGKSFDENGDELLAHNNVKNLGEFDSENLIKELRKILLKYNLIGLSIIIPENKSYALQEANKDIDYLCLGIPIVGNERRPTMEKIEAGAGVLYSDIDKINSLINNEGNVYDDCSESAKKKYRNYSQSEFQSRLLKIYNELI